MSNPTIVDIQCSASSFELSSKTCYIFVPLKVLGLLSFLKFDTFTHKRHDFTVVTFERIL